MGFHNKRDTGQTQAPRKAAWQPSGEPKYPASSSDTRRHVPPQRPLVQAVCRCLYPESLSGRKGVSSRKYAYPTEVERHSLLRRDRPVQGEDVLGAGHKRRASRITLPRNPESKDRLPTLSHNPRIILVPTQFAAG